VDGRGGARSADAGSGRSARREDGDCQRVEGDGSRWPELHRHERLGRQLRPGAVEQRQRRVAAHESERLRARHRLRRVHVARHRCHLGGAGHRTGGRAGAVPAEHHGGAGQRVGAAARDLDDAVGLPEGRGRQQRDGADPDGGRHAVSGGHVDDYAEVAGRSGVPRGGLHQPARARGPRGDAARRSRVRRHGGGADLHRVP
jgi:hypothetical protein